MKKILVLLSMFALASGAWASDASEAKYSYSITVASVPFADLPNDLVGYLVDANVKGSSQMAYNGAVMAKAELTSFAQKSDNTYWAYYDYHFYDQSGQETHKGSSHTEVTVSGTTGKTTVYFTLGDLSSGENVIWWNNMGVTDDYIADYPQEALIKATEYSQQNLLGVISSATTGRHLDMVVTPNAAIRSLGSNASFTSVVPEPTSGLLLLLGVVGLALKRKKAA